MFQTYYRILKMLIIIKAQESNPYFLAVSPTLCRCALCYSSVHGILSLSITLSAEYRRLLSVAVAFPTMFVNFPLRQTENRRLVEKGNVKEGGRMANLSPSLEYIWEIFLCVHSRLKLWKPFLYLKQSTSNPLLCSQCKLSFPR